MTTLEMDGLFTEEDIANKDFIMGQCKKCNEWSKIDLKDHIFLCKCGEKEYDMRGSRSIRTWLTTKDLKKRKT